MINIAPYRKDMFVFDPFHEFERFGRSVFDRDEFFSFKSDIKDNGDEIVLEAELPGFKKEDIDINIEGDLLSVSAERKEEENKESGKYIHKERFFGKYKRTYDISGIESNDIKAQYSDGVLTLSLPKKKEVLPESRHLEIN